MRIVVFTCGDAQYVFGQKISRLLSQDHEIEVYSVPQSHNSSQTSPFIRKSLVFKKIRSFVNAFGEWVLQLFLLSAFVFFRIKQASHKLDRDFVGFISKFLRSIHNSHALHKRLVKLIFSLSPSFRNASRNLNQGLIFQDYLIRVSPDRVIFVEENIFDSSIFALNAANQSNIDVLVVQYSSGIRAELLNYLYYETENLSRLMRLVVRSLTPSFLKEYRNSTLYFPLYVSIQTLLVGRISNFAFSGYLGFANSYMVDNDADYLDLPRDSKELWQRHRIEPVDVTYHRQLKSTSICAPQVAVLLPPDQFFNTINLNSEFSSYIDLVDFILNGFKNNFTQIDKVVFYLHPRSGAQLESLQSQYPDFHFSGENYVNSLSSIRLAVIFGSATYKIFGYLGIETLNFGIYGYDYHEVFENCGFRRHTYVKTSLDFLFYLQRFTGKIEFEELQIVSDDKSILDFFISEV